MNTAIKRATAISSPIPRVVITHNCGLISEEADKNVERGAIICTPLYSTEMILVHEVSFGSSPSGTTAIRYAAVCLADFINTAVKILGSSRETIRGSYQ